MHAVALVAAACTIGHARTTDDAPMKLENPGVITRADIERAHAGTALDAVQRYRSDLLTTRGQSSILLNKQQHPVVFMDNQMYGEIDVLRNVAADDIEEIRCYSGSDAVRLFGAQYAGGVIQLISRAGDSAAPQASGLLVDRSALHH